MAIPILSILKAVAPLAGRASDLVSTYVGLRTQRATLALEEHIRRIEDESVRSSEVLRATTEQLLALAQAVRVQQRRMMWCFACSVAALAAAVTALALR